MSGPWVLAYPPAMADVSLIMPVWRPRHDWLRAAIESALQQQSCDLELVVVDDGNAPPLVDGLGWLEDPRVRHVRIEHAGVAAARNAGVDVATGHFLRFVDADDVLEPGSTARLLQLASERVIAYEDTQVCDADLVPGRRISDTATGDVRHRCLMGDLDVRHVSMLFPRRVVAEAGPWDVRLRVLEDFDFVLRCLDHATVVPGDGVATFYRRHDASATRSRAAVRDAQRARHVVVDGYFARHPEARRTPLLREVRRRLRRDEAAGALHRREVLPSVISGLRLVPLSPREGVRVLLRALRISGATIVRTMTPPRRSRQRRAR